MNLTAPAPPSVLKLGNLDANCRNFNENGGILQQNKVAPPVHLHVQPDGCEGLLGPEAVHQGLAVGLPDLQLGLAVVPAQEECVT